jgi:hypothetical protein
LWFADTGRSEPVSYRIVDGETLVPLEFGSNDSYFVVFREAATATEVVVQKAAEMAAAEVVGPWNVAFQENRGAPASASFAKLQPLETHSDPGIRYLSGVATYAARITLPKPKRGQSLWIDLGRVGDVAEVRLQANCSAPCEGAVPGRHRVVGEARTNELEVRVAAAR